ncbi:MAG: HEAT repeat domain-containing protein [Methanophagales archaeon]|nr:HEAT repeat domain-containing protein [Methanophagales archaeon]
MGEDGGVEQDGVVKLKRKVSLALVGAIIGVALYHFRSALLTKCAEIIGYVESKPAMAQVIVALATLILAFVVVWDRLTDKPKLEIKLKDRTKISDDGRYSIEVPVLNKGRRDAYNCGISAQVFNRKSGKKVDEGSTSQPHLKPGEKRSSSVGDFPPFNGDFVARISAETHKSKTDKIIGYNIENNSEVIIFKYGIIQSLKFKGEKFLLKKYRDEWDVDLLSNGLKFERFYEPGVREKIIKILNKTGVKAVNPLIDRLEKDPNPDVRDAIVRTLGDIGDERAVEPLLRCLREVQEIKINVLMCGRAIAKIGDKKSVTSLIQILKDGNLQMEQRKAAADALGLIGRKIKDKSIEEALIEALEDSDKLVDTITEALGKVGSGKALKALEHNERIKRESEKLYEMAIEQIRFRIAK